MRAFQKMVVEKQEREQENVLLRQTCEALATECEERRVGRTEQGPGQAREELLLSEVQNLQERNK